MTAQPGVVLLHKFLAPDPSHVLPHHLPGRFLHDVVRRRSHLYVIPQHASDRGMTYAQFVGRVSGARIDRKEASDRNGFPDGDVCGVQIAVSQFQWRNGLALGLVLGIGLALFVVIATQSAGQLLMKLMSLDDTAAQWVMALMSLFATLLSGWAVLLLSETLAATRDAVIKADDANKVADDAVNLARQTFFAENRPWLALTVEQYDRPLTYNAIADRILAPLKLNVKNYGRCPAHFCAEMIYSELPLWGEAPDATFEQSEFAGMAPFIVFPSESVSVGSLISVRQKNPAFSGAIHTRKSHPLFPHETSRVVCWGFITCRIWYCGAGSGEIFETSKLVRWETTSAPVEFDTKDGWSADFEIQNQAGPGTNRAT